jgi:arylsulfatase A-like enzyme
MRFTDAYAACPVCSPTRASILTGKNPARLHLTNFLVGPRWPEDSPIVPIPDWQKFLPLEEVTIAEALKEAGYATGYVGKWHLGNTPYTPEAQGFDFNKGGCHMGAPKTYFDPYSIPNLPDRKKGEYLTDRLADEAIRFIEAHRDEPFFLYFAHYAVHIPLQAKDDRTAKYAAKAKAMAATDVPEFGQEGRNKVRQVQNHPVYAGMVESVDDSVGRIMKKLADLGVDDNTIIFFFSDNGGLSTAEGWPTSNLPLRAGKGWLYEGGIREPTIIKWPGVTPPGSTCDTPMISDDFYPTILQMAGLRLRPEQHMDGTSLVPLLKGQGGWRRDTLSWHYPHYSNQGSAPAGAIRDGDWKLIEWYEDGRLELYNLRDDLGEANDLATAMPEKARELQKMLAEWRRSVSAQMPARKEPTRPGGKG